MELVQSEVSESASWGWPPIMQLCGCCAVCHADGSAHGVVFLNSNGMDVILNARSLTYK